MKVAPEQTEHYTALETPALSDIDIDAAYENMYALRDLVKSELWVLVDQTESE